MDAAGGTRTRDLRIMRGFGPFSYQLIMSPARKPLRHGGGAVLGLFYHIITLYRMILDI